jgi:hypothetical protein
MTAMPTVPLEDDEPHMPEGSLSVADDGGSRRQLRA